MVSLIALVLFGPIVTAQVTGVALMTLGVHPSSDWPRPGIPSES